MEDFRGCITSSISLKVKAIIDITFYYYYKEKSIEFLKISNKLIWIYKNVLVSYNHIIVLLNKKTLPQSLGTWQSQVF